MCKLIFSKFNKSAFVGEQYIDLLLSANSTTQQDALYKNPLILCLKDVVLTSESNIWLYAYMRLTLKANSVCEINNETNFLLVTEMKELACKLCGMLSRRDAERQTNRRSRRIQNIETWT